MKYKEKNTVIINLSPTGRKKKIRVIWKNEIAFSDQDQILIGYYAFEVGLEFPSNLILWSWKSL